MWCVNGMKRMILYAFLISSCLQVFHCQVSTGDPPGVRSLQKCEEYKQYAFEEEDSPVLMPNAGTQLRNKCPFDKVELIIGGESAKPNEFPHMVGIGFENSGKKEWDCGGSLISEDYVLTAAHCLLSERFGAPTMVRLGGLSINYPVDGENVQEIRIKQLIRHPDYIRPPKYNDIALLLLETRPNLGVAVRPACLFTERMSNTKSAIATGWGFTEQDGAKSDWLKKIVLKFFPVEKCNVAYKSLQLSFNRGVDDEIQICAGSDIDDEDTCKGDSGGPLQLYSDVTCMYDIMAITSTSTGCGFGGVPGVYTRVYPYLKWIEDIVWP